MYYVLHIVYGVVGNVSCGWCRVYCAVPVCIWRVCIARCVVCIVCCV